MFRCDPSDPRRSLREYGTSSGDSIVRRRRSASRPRHPAHRCSLLVDAIGTHNDLLDINYQSEQFHHDSNISPVDLK